MVHKNRRERTLLQKSSQVIYRRPRSTSLWVQIRTIKNSKTSLEPLQTLNLLHQYSFISMDQLPVQFLVTKTVTIATSIVHKVRTVLYPDLYVLTDGEHWTMTPETHKCAAAAGSFCFVTAEIGDPQGHMQIDHCAVCTTIILPQ